MRDKIADFIGAEHTCEIIFTRNTTEAINLVAFCWGKQNVLPGDEIVLSPMEHHSNLVPWQQLAAEREAKLVFLELSEEGEVTLESAQRLIGPKTKLVAISQMSNVLGSIPPVQEISALAHKFGAMVLVDGAQGVPHLPTSVKDLGCDFLAFSFHKMLGPTGVGVCSGVKKKSWKRCRHLCLAGDMISSVDPRQKSL